MITSPSSFPVNRLFLLYHPFLLLGRWPTIATAAMILFFLTGCHPQSANQEQSQAARAPSLPAQAKALQPRAKVEHDPITPEAQVLRRSETLAVATPTGSTQQEQVKAAEAVDSHTRMLQRIKELQEEERSSVFFGGGRLLAAKRRFVQARTQKKRSARELLESAEELGVELSYAGSPEDALKVIAATEPILETIKKSGAPPKALRAWESRLLFVKGIAGMRKAENENCIHCQEGEGCLFPIRPKGIHQMKTGAEIARDCMVELALRHPDDLAAAWLANIAHMTLGTFPEEVPQAFRLPANQLESDIDFPWFPNIALPLGLDTMSRAGGAIADDFDGDHLIDIFVSDWSSTGQSRFFHNNGDGSFTDRTKEANLMGICGGLNANHADYDNDGDLDILILRGAWLMETGKHPNSLLQNDGKGRFRDVAYDAGIAGTGKDFPTQAAAWADFDRDGDLDLFIGNERFPAQLFQNDGQGQFINVAQQLGITGTPYTKGVAWGDVNSDGYPDLYLSNGLAPNQLYRNDAGQGFTDITEQAGMAAPDASFAVWFWDYNNDGHLDLFCPGYLEGVQHVAASFFDKPLTGQLDVLYEGKGDGTFKDVAQERGLTQVSQTMGCNFGDLDNDGFLDMYLGTGYPGLEGLMPNVMYRNDQGIKFQDVSVAGGFSHLQKGHGVAFADFDHDGDQDIFEELGGAYEGDRFRNALFENPGFGNHSLSVRLVGVDSCRDAIGAKIQATFTENDETRTVHRWVGGGSSFGGNPYRQSIGIGKAKFVQELTITWPRSGNTQVFKNIEAGQLIVVTEGKQQAEHVMLSPTPFQK